MRHGFVPPFSFGLATLAVLAGASHDPPARLSGGHVSKRCTGTISSLDDIADAIKCTMLNINAFTVPDGETFDLSDLLDGTTVNVLGTVTFATGSDWAGPLFEVSGNDITFNGNGHTWDGNGAYWWDGEGSNGGRTKPRPFFKVKISGTMSDVYLLNPPVQAFSVANPAALTISGATVDVADGNTDSLGHNTDGFDISSSTSLTITGAYVDNQDDCIAINDATDLIFTNNKCNGGHGISIGSIKTGDVVSGVTISDNVVTASANGLRIKTYSDATDASVSDVVYSNNTATGCTTYGVVIEQDYTNSGATGTATNDVTIKGVSFTGGLTTVGVTSSAEQVYVLCGSTSCSGTWDWTKLSTTGGKAGSVSNADITGYTVGDGSANGSGSSSATTTAKATTTTKASSTTTKKSSTTTKVSSTTSKKSSSTTKAASMTAAVLAVSTASSTSRTTAPSGALVVKKSPSSGQYSTIAAAITSLGSSTADASIFVEAGTYSGSIDITYGGKLTIYGYTTDTSSYTSNVVILTNDGSNVVDGNDDGSGTLRVHTDDFTLYNVNVVNSYGEGSQALALSAYGERHGYYGCSFVGYQDTVLTDAGTQVFAQSYVEGATDFIFGQTANTWFHHSVIAAKAAGTITAPGRPSSSSTGIYVFNSCTIKAAASATTSLSGLVYLGRPWTEYARAVFMFSSLSDIIAPAGWEEWSSSEPNTSDVLLAEYSNSGAGSTTSSRVSWSTQLTATSVESYTIENMLGSTYADWVDTTYL